MAELVFVEGVSGIGKSTMVRMLAKELQLLGYTVKKYEEFDYTNPIDFYCTAYLSFDEYTNVCEKYKSDISTIHENTIVAEDVRLIRYYDGDTPLFNEPLLSELSQKEFCYNPSRLVPIDKYTSTYSEVWHKFASNIDETHDFIIFDGSLLHHPINDMMRNYNIVGEQAVAHVAELLNSLGAMKHRIIYLKTDNIGAQLRQAHADRRQSVPTDEQINFWKSRYKNDMIVLGRIRENYQIYDVSNSGWNLAREQILNKLI